MEVIDEFALVLGIDTRAVGFWSNVLYLFRTDNEIGSLIDECAGKSRRYIDNYVAKVRHERIKNEKYSSIDEFIECFNNNKIEALERMFQEPINPSKLSKLITSDPVHIFNIHSTLPFAVWFMSFVIYL